MVGIICDLSFKNHWLQESYYMSIKNIFDDVKIVFSENDLIGLNLLFICDEHFMPNKLIWMNDKFINKCNSQNIQVVIFNNEKILNSFFPWNEENQRNVNKFKNKIQFVYDVNDAKILNCDINKTYMSKYYLHNLKLEETHKKDKIVFVGNYKNNTYGRRKILLDKIVNKFDVDIIDTDHNRSIKEYLNLINQYKYVLSPLGNGDFLPMRFYETLYVGSIPIQECTNDMIYYMTEEMDKSIFFESIDKLILKDIKLPNQYYMEDFMIYIFSKYKIL